MPVRNFIAAATVLIAAGAALSGQESATLTLKSDARVGGQLIDLNASAFTIRVDGQERQIPKGDVAVIDFGGDGAGVPSEAANMQPGQHLVQLRSGQVVSGEFVDIGGTNPLRLSFNTASGAREFSSNEVRRIYMTKPVADAPAAAPAQPSIPGNGRVVTVSSRQAWTDTGIRVRRGETLVFDATGEIEFDTSGAKATPGRNSNGAFDNRMPVPTAPTATLIGRIAPVGASARVNTGQAGAFAVGDQKSVVMPGEGVLFLGINDTGFADNRGEWRVTIGPGGLNN